MANLELTPVAGAPAGKVDYEHDPVPGAIGFRIQPVVKGGVVQPGKWAHTWDGTATRHRFAAGFPPYRVQSLMLGPEGMYPPPSGVPFGSKPRIQAPDRFVGINNPQPFIGKSIAGFGNFNETLSYEGCTGVIEIRDNDCITPGCRIYLLNCTAELRISGNRGLEAGRNFFQLDDNDVTGYIRGNSVRGGAGEDVISLISSGGANVANPLYVEDNRIEGTDWTSGSGSGIMIEGGTPRHVVVRRNSLLNPGQVGIGVHHSLGRVLENTLYSDGKHGAGILRVGIDCADARSAGCEVSGNRVDWRNSGGGYEPYSTLTNPYPVGWASNDWDWRATPAELAAMAVVYP